METPLIEFQSVTKRFNSTTVLDNVNLSIYENQITTIVGKSGTGKSVLLKHIVGLLTPEEGEVFIEGKSLRAMKSSGEWDQYRRHISYMFQGNALFDSMTVFDNVALPLRQTTDFKKKEIEKRVMMRIEQTELSDAKDKYPAELSGGMQKRVALARALVTDPKIVLFDEPTTGQDLVRRNVILSMISHYKKQFGFTAVLISHDIPDVFFISDRIALLWNGTVVFQGTYEQAIQLEHPIIDEILKSFEGFQDELTGLLSKQMFRLRYASTFEHDRGELTGAAILFGVNFSLLAESLGHHAAVEVVKVLGTYVNKHFSPVGGFSTRQERGQILTIVPHLSVTEAKEIVHVFAKSLLEEALSSIRSLIQVKMGEKNCFEVVVSAGITEARSNDDMEKIMDNAAEAKKTIGIYRCAMEELQ